MHIPRWPSLPFLATRATCFALLLLILPFLASGPLQAQGGRDLTRPVAAKTTVRVHYDVGFGNSISIRGDAGPLSWSRGEAATWSSGNVWIWEGPANLGRFEFKPLINDTTWSTGANYVFPDGLAQVDIYPFFGPSQGSLQFKPAFWSPQLGNTRTLRIYLPPSYAENTLKHYPVLYMHDGQNLFQGSTAFGGVEWEVDETLDHEIGNGRVREVIVVGVDNTQGRIFEYTPFPDPFYGGGGGDLYLDFLEDTVKPWVDATYRTLPDAANTLTIGSSLGGLISFHAGWSRADIFGKIGGMSSSFWWDNESYTVTVENHSGARPPAVFYVDSGGFSDGAAQTLRMRDALDQAGYQFGVDLFHYLDQGGTHNEASWRDRFHIPLRELLPWD